MKNPPKLDTAEIGDLWVWIEYETHFIVVDLWSNSAYDWATLLSIKKINNFEHQYDVPINELKRFYKKIS